MTWRASVVTLYPQAFPGTLDLSVIGRGRGQGVWALETVDLRSFGEGRHRKVDDTPAGGGPGLVLRADVAARAIDSIAAEGRPWLFPSPRGLPLNQAMARSWAAGPGLCLFCGRFEGLDERVIERRGLVEVSVGDAVLAGGEAAALLILEACVRLLPGVLGNAQSLEMESFGAQEGLLEHPQYTRPAVFEGLEIPAALTGGDHDEVAAWRLAAARRLTARRRPDLQKP